ncbi:hypothetical protein CR492_02420 [Methylocella silvestris]|uniref:Uncharacterized protein n=1 Tax=Methylocella silvestris TaxID=199596 RepID=A0A2J7TM34_METSI|nr:hypothetical protein CR492_02420 [Methylocella silvestris]
MIDKKSLHINKLEHVLIVWMFPSERDMLAPPNRPSTISPAVYSRRFRFPREVARGAPWRAEAMNSLSGARSSPRSTPDNSSLMHFSPL